MASTIYATCLACDVFFGHDPPPADAVESGYYIVRCPSGHRMLRCTSCRYYILHEFGYTMAIHQKRKHLESPPDFEQNISFTDDNSMLFSENNYQPSSVEVDDGAPTLTDKDMLKYGIPADRPHIKKMFQCEGEEDLDTLREEEIIEDLFPSDNTYTSTSNIPLPYNCNNDDGDDTKMKLSDFDQCHMNGSHNKLFFMQQHNYENGGMRGIVNRANGDRGLATEKETRLMFNMLDNLLDMSSSQKEKYLLGYQSLMKCYDTAPNVGIKIPVTVQDANRLCLHNSNSSFANIPCEEPFEIEGHMCINANAKLSTIFAKGTKLALLQDHKGNVYRDGFNGTPAAQDILSEARSNLENGDVNKTCFGYAMVWSDSYEQFGSRKRDGSMWLFVMRVCAPEGLSTSSEHTFCLAFGPSKLDHSSVIEHYMKEFKDMQKGVKRYWPDMEGNEKTVNTSFSLVAYPADLPERNAALYTLLEGLFGMRSGHAGRTDPKHLPSCERCFWSMVELALYLAAPDSSVECPSLRTCNICCKFDQFTTSNAKKFDKTEGTKYPIESCSNLPQPKDREVGISHLVSVEQSFPWLVQVVRFAFDNHSRGLWRYKYTVEAYLQSAAINADIQKRVCDAADRYKKQKIVHEREYIPRVWQLGYSIAIFVEASMHLLAHGIVASIIDLTEAVFSEHNLWSSFTDFAKPYLDDIATFRLDWCRVKSLPKANWLAEDEFGFCRIMLFLYGNFIQQKNIDSSSRNDVLKTSLVNLEQLLCSCQVMVSLLMCKREIPIDRLDIHIRIFLDCCHRFCNNYCPSVTEFWFTKMNFISLLNLPKQIAKFGHIGYTFESVFERYIQIVKPVLKTARKYNIESLGKKMIFLQKESNMAYIRNGLFPELEKKEKPNRYQGGVRIYKSKDEIMNRIAEGRCLSCFYNCQLKNMVMIPYSVGRDTFKVFAVTFTLSKTKNVCGLSCGKFTLATNQSDKLYDKSMLMSAGKNDDIATQFGLLLPYCPSAGLPFESLYSMITHEWLVLGEDGEVDVAKLCTLLFARDL